MLHWHFSYAGYAGCHMSKTESFVFELNADVIGGSARLTLQLDEPQLQLRVRDPRSLGRAEAQFDKKSWSAKHYWAEGSGEERVTIFEFDEPLPAGPMVLVIPVG